MQIRADPRGRLLLPRFYQRVTLQCPLENIRFQIHTKPPDFETRVAIVMEKAEQNGLKLSYDIIELIGTHIKTNIRDLEGTIIRLLAHSSLSNREIDYDLTKSVIKERLGSKIGTELDLAGEIKAQLCPCFRIVVH